MNQFVENNHQALLLLDYGLDARVQMACRGRLEMVPSATNEMIVL